MSDVIPYSNFLEMYEFHYNDSITQCRICQIEDFTLKPLNPLSSFYTTPAGTDRQTDKHE